ncbi:MAG: DUF1361 domain-containing protein, partial [Myxococcota bacterium]
TSAVCSALLLGRVYWTEEILFLAMGWNLLLAWIPFALSAAMLSARHLKVARWVLLPVLAAIWLVFLPNAPYLVTDLIHLRERAPVPYWYDIAMLGMFASTGLLLGVRSLEHVHRLLERPLGAALSWSVIIVISGLCGLGIYLGRFLRWNSWDLATRPEAVLTDILALFLDPSAHRGPWGFTAVFAAMLLAFYAAVRVQPAQPKTSM